MHKFLAEVMVDAENLPFLKQACDIIVQLLRRGNIVAEWLLEDDAAPLSSDLSRDSSIVEIGDDRLETLRRGGKIEYPVPAHSCLQLLIGSCIVEFELVIENPLTEAVPFLHSPDARSILLPDALISVISPADRDDRRFLVQLALLVQLVERRKKFALRKVTGGAEDDDGACRKCHHQDYRRALFKYTVWWQG